MRVLSVWVAVCLSIVLSGHQALGLDVRSSDPDVVVLGTTFERLEKALKGVDYVAGNAGIRSLEGLPLLYEPTSEEYRVRRWYVAVKEAHDAEGRPFAGLEGRQIKIVGERVGGPASFAEGEMRLSGRLLCDTSLLVRSFAAIEPPPGSEVCTCSKISFDGHRCSYTLPGGTVEAGHGRQRIDVAISAVGHTECPAPDISGSSGWATVSLKNWQGNTGILSLDVSANESRLARTASFDVGQPLIARQQGAPCSVRKVGQAPLVATPQGPKGVLKVSVSPPDCSWRLMPADWQVAVPPEVHCGDGEASYIVAPDNPFGTKGASVRVLFLPDGAVGATVELKPEP
jgi:hypothetical protein